MRKIKPAIKWERKSGNNYVSEISTLTTILSKGALSYCWQNFTKKISLYLGSAEKLLLFSLIADYMNIHCNQVQEKKSESVQNPCTPWKGFYLGYYVPQGFETGD